VPDIGRAVLGGEPARSPSATRTLSRRPAPAGQPGSRAAAEYSKSRSVPAWAIVQRTPWNRGRVLAINAARKSG